MKQPALFLFVLLLICRCQHPSNPTSHKSWITKIEIAKGGCLRSCPVTAISIDSTLTYNYFGGQNAKPKGYYTGKVTEQYWEALNAQLKKVDFEKLFRSTDYLPLDGEPAEVICYWGKIKKHVFVSIDQDENNDYKSKDFRVLAYSYVHVQLHKMKDTAKFEVEFQHLRNPEPKPNIEQVKFPPPKHKRI